MSDVPNDPNAMSGPQSGGDEPSEEEVRAYLSQLRGAPVDQVIAEVSSALINAAQVKLGRKDGRLLLDVVAAMTDQLRGQVPDELTKQLDDVLAKLRVAQVEAEREVAAQGHEEADDLPGQATQGAGASPSSPGGQPATSDPASRLWTPGN